LPRFVVALAEAGADDVISDFPDDAVRYFRNLHCLNEPQKAEAMESRQPRG
jgi:hypothetical protein